MANNASTSTNPPVLTKCFIYLRVSGKSQIEGDGFERQRKAVTDYADRHNFVIAGEFMEMGVSGTKDLEDRPAMIEMITALQSNGVRTVLIEKLDRLARDLMCQETLIAEFRKGGFTLISVAEPDLLDDDPGRKLMRQIFGAIYEYEKTLIVLKLRGARNRIKIRTGRCEGRKPYGHREGEAAALEIMTNMRRAGFDCAHIAAHLDRLGHKTRLGGPWGPATVAKILSRRIGQAPRGSTEEERAVVDRIHALHAQGMSQRGIAKQLNEDGLRTRRGGPWVHQYVAAVLGRPEVAA